MHAYMHVNVLGVKLTPSRLRRYTPLYLANRNEFFKSENGSVTASLNKKICEKIGALEFSVIKISSFKHAIGVKLTPPTS